MSTLIVNTTYSQNIATLPIELWQMIFSHCDAKSLLHLLDTCKSLYVYKRDKSIWSRFYKPNILSVVIKGGYPIFAPNRYVVTYQDDQYTIYGLSNHYRNIFAELSIKMLDKSQMTYTAYSGIYDEDSIHMKIDGISFYAEDIYDGEISINIISNTFTAYIYCVNGWEGPMINKIHFKERYKFTRQNKGRYVYDLYEMLDELLPDWLFYSRHVRKISQFIFNNTTDIDEIPE